MALEKLCEIKQSDVRCQAMHKYASTLIKHEPEATLDVLIDIRREGKFRDVAVPELMSALRSVPKEYIPKANQYVMDKCIKSKRITEKSVHNMAFYLYAESDNEPALISYLEGEESKRENGQPIFFEVDYALNLCKQKEDRLNKELEPLTNLG